MFGAEHYVPILRWKKAERLALKELRDEDRVRITPLIEITPKSFNAPRSGANAGKKPDARTVLEEQAKTLLESWRNAPFFLDLGLIEFSVPLISGVRHPLACIADVALGYKLAIVPVTGIARKGPYQCAIAEIIQKHGCGVCFRLTPGEVLAAKFRTRIEALLDRLGLEKSNVDLLLDYQTFAPDNPSLKNLLDRVPALPAWRSFTVARGAFPENLGKCQLGENRILRDDWLSWKAQFFDDATTHRRASFSDYTIQWGAYKEPVEGCNPSVSVRYTLEDEWLVMRGEAPVSKATSKTSETRPGREQWYGHAQLLCEDAQLFYGEDFSEGDKYIFQKSLRQGGTGNYETWLRAGINHHMTVVARQIANLAAP